MAGLGERMVMVIDIQVNLSLWQALKLRVAGASYVQGYVEHLIDMSLHKMVTDDDDEDEE